MHVVLQTICGELDQIAAHINSTVPNDEPLNIAHANWSFPGITRVELADAASSLANLVRERGKDDLGSNAERLQDYPRRLQFLRTNTVAQIWGNAGSSVPNYFVTLQALQLALSSALKPDTELTQSLQRSAARARAMEARLNDVEPRSERLQSMVERIEQAYDAADQLPTDLHALKEARDRISKLVDDAERNQAAIAVVRASAEDSESTLKASAEQASATIARLDKAYSAATSQGLAAAFAERSKQLGFSMWVWVLGLVFALLLGGLVGIYRVQALIELLKTPEVSQSVVFANLFLSVLSIGAPVWFGWLSTKQIGQRFRLSEDYAFKASVSRAYEGYRREAARVDADLEARLLASALTRLDEQPLRLVEASNYGSPIHELASSDLVKEAVKLVPGFPGHVKNLARDVLNARDAKKVTTDNPVKPANPSM